MTPLVVTILVVVVFPVRTCLHALSVVVIAIIVAGGDGDGDGIELSELMSVYGSDGIGMLLLSGGLSSFLVACLFPIIASSLVSVVVVVVVVVVVKIGIVAGIIVVLVAAKNCVFFGCSISVKSPVVIVVGSGCVGCVDDIEDEYEDEDVVEVEVEEEEEAAVLVLVAAI